MIRPKWFNPFHSRTAGAAAVSLLAAFSASAQVGQEPQAPLAKDAVVVEMTSAQGADESLGRVPSVFGTQDEDISTVSWTDFRPYTSNATYASDTAAGGRWTTGGSSFLYASLPSDIPNGALVTQVVFYVKDTNATNDFTGRLCRYYTDSNTGGSPASDCPLSVSTSGTPGDAVPFANVSIPILRRTDITGDGPVEVINWVLHYNDVLAEDGSIQIRQVRILWRRQVSPAPASATFADVPTSFIYFRAIEALAASGITSGCGGSNFCPNGTVTRGEMAAFLSRALGLHWPAF